MKKASGVSVPLRGLDMRKPTAKIEGSIIILAFQSPCGD